MTKSCDIALSNGCSGLSTFKNSWFVVSESGCYINYVQLLMLRGRDGLSWLERRAIIDTMMCSISYEYTTLGYHPWHWCSGCYDNMEVRHSLWFQQFLIKNTRATWCCKFRKSFGRFQEPVQCFYILTKVDISSDVELYTILSSKLRFTANI